MPSDGDLGWDLVTGPSGGLYDDPLVSWLPTIGVDGLVAYAGDVFPDLASDGLDSDRDKWGPDGLPGIAHFDDDGSGVCVGSVLNGQPCIDALQCLPPRPGETSWCEKRDEPDEWCPGGVPAGDDSCGSADPAGVDEPNER